MQQETHPNSHIVFIRRAPMFAAESRKELDEYFADSHRGIGSYFAKGGMRTATGLSITEENLLLPYILNIPQEDRDFRKEVTIWYQNLETKIPAHKVENGITKGGKPLEIGLDSSNSQPVSKDNLPINIEEFLRYRHIIGHPFTALNESEGRSNPLKSYFVYDPEEVSLGAMTVNESKDKALTAYLVVKEKPQTVKQYLVLLGVNLSTIKKGEESIKLRELADSRPDDFIRISEDKNKSLKYTIEEMVNYKILDRVGNRLVTRDGEQIGRSVNEAVLYLKDTHNSKAFATLKAQLQEAWKKNSTSFETDEDLEVDEPKKSLVDLVNQSKGGLEIQEEEKDVATVPGALGDIDDEDTETEEEETKD